MKLLVCALMMIPLIAVDYSSQIDSKVYRNKHGLYCVPKGDRRPAVDTIKQGKVWEEATLNFIASIYKSGTAIVHAGTYFGDMLPFFSKLATAVWAFEPVSLNHACAQKTLEVNGIKNVKLHHYALSHSKTQLTMLTKVRNYRLGGASKITKQKNNQHGIYETIQSVMLDEILADRVEKIGVIHLDIEGHEVEALQGAKKVIDEDRPVIILEEGHSDSMFTFMESIGYRRGQKVNHNVVFYPE